MDRDAGPPSRLVSGRDLVHLLVVVATDDCSRRLATPRPGPEPLVVKGQHVCHERIDVRAYGPLHNLQFTEYPVFDGVPVREAIGMVKVEIKYL